MVIKIDKVEDKTQELTKWVVRLIYFVSIGILAQLCIQSYNGQQDQNEDLLKMSSFANQFDALEENMVDVGQKARNIADDIRLSQQQNSGGKNPALRGSFSNNTQTQNSAAQAPLDLVVVKNSLIYSQANGL